MVSIEEVGLIIAVVSGTIVPAVFFLMQRHFRTADASSERDKKEMVDVQTSLRQIWERLELIHSDVRLHEFRLNKLDDGKWDQREMSPRRPFR